MRNIELIEKRFSGTCINGKWNCPTVPLQSSGAKGVVPEVLAREAYKEYADQYGTDQSFERLHERGGFGVIELASLLFDRIKRLEQALGRYSMDAGHADHCKHMATAAVKALGLEFEETAPSEITEAIERLTNSYKELT